MSEEILEIAKKFAAKCGCPIEWASSCIRQAVICRVPKSVIIEMLNYGDALAMLRVATVHAREGGTFNVE